MLGIDEYEKVRLKIKELEENAKKVPAVAKALSHIKYFVL